MKRLLTAVLLVYVCLVLGGCSWIGLSKSVSKRPNVVILISDDQGWADKYSKDEPQEPADWALYNLADDPEEKNDVAAKHPEVVKELHERFIEHRKRDYDGDLIESAYQ